MTMEEEEFVYAEDEVSETGKGCVIMAVGCIVSIMLLALIFAVGIIVSCLR